MKRSLLACATLFIATLAVPGLAEDAKPAKPRQVISGSISMIYEGLPVAETDKEAKIGDKPIPGAVFLVEPNGRGQINGQAVSLREGQSFRVGDKVSFNVEEGDGILLLPQVGQTVTYANYFLEIYRVSSRILRVCTRDVTGTGKEAKADPGRARTDISENYDALNGLSSVVVASGYEITGLLRPLRPQNDSQYLIVTLARK